MKKRDIYLNLAFILLGIVLYLVNPLDMENHQRIVLSILVFVTCTWATSSLDKSVACIILLLAFVIFGNTKPLTIISQVWGDTILLIMTTTLLSTGMMKTGLVERHLHKLLSKAGDSTLKLLSISYVLGMVLIFLVPQAFARVIILGTIFNSIFVARNENEKRAKEVLIFNVFIAVTMTSMAFSNGDIVLNQAAIGFQEGVVNNLNPVYWFQMMSVPTLITAVVTLFVIKIGFKNELSYFSPGMIKTREAEAEKGNPRTEKIIVLMMLIIVVLWMTEPLHGLKAWLVTLAGIGIMFFLKV